MLPLLKLGVDVGGFLCGRSFCLVYRFSTLITNLSVSNGIAKASAAATAQAAPVRLAIHSLPYSLRSRSNRARSMKREMFPYIIC